MSDSIRAVIYVTVKEYAASQRVHERTVWRWIRKGLVDAHRHGERGEWRIQLPRAHDKAS